MRSISAIYARRILQLCRQRQEELAQEEDVEWGSDKEKDDLKRLDFGLTMGGGVEINSIQIGLTYALGLANISSYTDYGTKINNRVLGLSVGYKFGGK